MDTLKKAVLNRLINFNQILNKTPGRRDIPFSLYRDCCKYFGSLNNAKKLVGLRVFRRKCDPLSQESMKYTKNLVTIVSYLTFDGHLYKTLRGFMVSSKRLYSLIEFNKCAKDQFGINVDRIQKMEYKTMKGDGVAYLYFYFNVNIARFLNLIGVPRGDKMVTVFNVPGWIKKDKEFAREYLRVAYYCEGCRFRSGNKYRIQINLNKTVEYLDNCLLFMNTLRNMLSLFGIETTNVQIKAGNIRKDGKVTKLMRFDIRVKDVNKFINEIGWFK